MSKFVYYFLFFNAMCFLAVTCTPLPASRSIAVNFPRQIEDIESRDETAEALIPHSVVRVVRSPQYNRRPHNGGRGGGSGSGAQAGASSGSSSFGGGRGSAGSGAVANAGSISGGRGGGRGGGNSNAIASSNTISFTSPLGSASSSSSFAQSNSFGNQGFGGRRGQQVGK